MGGNPITVNKRKQLFIGVTAMTAMFMVFLLPVVPLTLSVSSNQPPSALCKSPPQFQWFGASAFLDFKNIYIGNFTFSAGLLVNGSQYVQPSGTYNFTTHTWSIPGHWNRHGITNTTAFVSFTNLKLKHLNGTLELGIIQYYVNGTQDSYFLVSGASLSTTHVNSTALKHTVSASHVQAQIGPQFAKTFKTSPISVSFDNFKTSTVYNCITGNTSYGFSTMASPLQLSNMAQSFAWNKIVGSFVK